MKEYIKLFISSLLILLSFFIWYYYAKQETLSISSQNNILK